jgi:adenylate cyclase
MFADVRGYTALTGKATPADMTDRISSFQRWAKQEIERNHGVVDKFAGDAVMATFNVSGAHVDHTLHALRAAFALRDKAVLLQLPIGVGMAVGPAVVGQLTEGGNVTVLGETTNLAARLQASAQPGEIVLSAEAHRRLKGRLEKDGLSATAEDLPIKGFDEPVSAYRMRGTPQAANEALARGPA